MEKVQEGNNRDKQGKGRKGKGREGKERKWKGHGSQWLDGCDVGNAPSSERASTFHLFPIQQNCFHPPFIPLSSSHSPPQQLHPPPPPPPQHFPTTLSHHLPSTAHITAINMSLSCMSPSPHQPPRPHRIGRREEKRRKYTKTTTNPSSIRPPTSEAIGHRPRHPLQPCRIPRRPGPRLWRHIPPRYASKQQ